MVLDETGLEIQAFENKVIITFLMIMIVTKVILTMKDNF